MKKKPLIEGNTLTSLSENIHAANTFFLRKAQKQVNTSLTLRNWLIGFYLVEYEQSGKDRTGTNIVL
jgi:hypothetical protein